MSFQCDPCLQVVMTDTIKETSVSVPDLSSDPCDLAAALLTSIPASSERSAPNLSSSAASTNHRASGGATSANHESPSAASLLETFAAVARRRASGSVSASGAGGGVTSTNANNSRNTANSLNSGGLFGRGLTTNSVSSLVRLALSSNFPSGLLNQVSRTTNNTNHLLCFVDLIIHDIHFRLSPSQVSIPVKTMASQGRPMRRSRSPWRSS